MTNTEEQTFFDEEDCDISSQTQSGEANLDNEQAPAWEQYWDEGRQDPQQPEITVDNYDWEAWLAEIQELPMPGYKPFDNLLKAPRYANS